MVECEEDEERLPIAICPGCGAPVEIPGHIRGRRVLRGEFPEPITMIPAPPPYGVESKSVRSLLAVAIVLLIVYTIVYSGLALLQNWGGHF